MKTYDDIGKKFEEYFAWEHSNRHPIITEGMEACKNKIPRESCPYNDEEQQDLWIYGWDAQNE